MFGAQFPPCAYNKPPGSERCAVGRVRRNVVHTELRPVLSEFHKEVAESLAAARKDMLWASIGSVS